MSVEKAAGSAADSDSVLLCILLHAAVTAPLDQHSLVPDRELGLTAGIVIYQALAGASALLVALTGGRLGCDVAATAQPRPLIRW